MASIWHHTVQDPDFSICHLVGNTVNFNITRLYLETSQHDKSLARIGIKKSSPKSSPHPSPTSTSSLPDSRPPHSPSTDSRGRYAPQQTVSNSSSLDPVHLVLRTPAIQAARSPPDPPTACAVVPGLRCSAGPAR